ncbi:DNA methyltransferase [Edaphobacter sp.]|uniref:site-specific DNA-methyltransferase n=1 Tax=Edaphobacter sp. TaxID=1934404 RepID=UPI002DC01F7A|nr:DNA methyltransferase [Edaphobacter sp.]HEU5341116.1 DNA methyltransferase [Edaphobacter sp.]
MLTSVRMLTDKNQLYYGDNLEVLRDYIPAQSVDLIYLDPPFNSRQDYNVLFAEKDGHSSAAQITAFKDTWEWNEEAARSYEEVVEQGGRVADAMRAFRTLLGGSDMLAYLAMMAPRLVELRRVLKETGSIYLHCDPTASHYLKLLMDGVFGAQFFHSEIIWKRNSAHSDAKRFGSVHDTILFYSKGNDPFWSTQYQAYEPGYVEQYYRYKDEDGRRFMSGDLSAAGLQGGGYTYEWKGVTRVWRVPVATMERLDSENRVFYTRNGIPRFKRYLDESKGMPAQDVWTDIESLKSWMAERLGYPTQKPEALLERILRASSNEGDLVLDPFCGCGTTVQVAQKLNRRWIGIDITHLAIGLIKGRLDKAFENSRPPIRQTYEVIGEPRDLAGARQLAEENKYQFQYWALGECGARPTEGIKKGADRGIDGRLYFHDDRSGKSKQIIFSVKGGQNIGVSEVRDLRGVLDREKAEIGVYISFAEPTKPMLREASEAGFYASVDGSKYPRVQLLTIKGLLEGTQRLERPLHVRDVTFKSAPRHREAPASNFTLPLKDGEE